MANEHGATAARETLVITRRRISTRKWNYSVRGMVEDFFNSKNRRIWVKTTMTPLAIGRFQTGEIERADERE